MTGLPRWLPAILLSVVLVACGTGGETSGGQVTIGLSTSLPLVWGENGDIRGQFASSGAPHWAKRLLDQRGKVVLLDSLAGARGLALPLDGLLVLVQPRPLSPAENVALDAWVRKGGRLLLFADPMLTAESVYPLGDPRRPETIVMLSPILRHWGLELEFAEDQPAGPRGQKAFDLTIPVDLSGRFRLLKNAVCHVEGAEIAAECQIGKGRVMAVADAAVFDRDGPANTQALQGLLHRLIH